MTGSKLVHYTLNLRANYTGPRESHICGEYRRRAKPEHYESNGGNLQLAVL